jgi:predicted acyltransferase
MASALLPETLPARRTYLEEAPPSPPATKPKPERLVSLDAYRGFIMIAMASSGFAFARAVKEFKLGGPVWDFLAFQFEHVPWIGCSFWDLIQPSFMFMVGVALPYSYAARKATGDSEGRIFVHTAVRAFLLVFLGVFLSSNWSTRTHFTFTNVLSQIGLGYVFVYLLRGRALVTQLGALAAILIGYSALFATYPVPAEDYDWRAVGVRDSGEKLSGWSSHWAKNSNAAHRFDVWFLNLFPSPYPPSPALPRALAVGYVGLLGSPSGPLLTAGSLAAAPRWTEQNGYRLDDHGDWRFAYNVGGYGTLNFVPSMATMLLGLMAGEMLRGSRSRRVKFGILVAAGLACLVVGLAAAQVVPSVKRIWTPSWAVYSTGWTLLILAAFYLVIDMAGWKAWAFPFVVVGMNSIAMYCMSQLLRGWVGQSMKIHLPTAWFEGPYGLIFHTTMILVVLWLICLWMYRRKIFLKI